MARPAPVIGTIGFRPIADADIPLLHRWINTPHVAEWWDAPRTLEDVAGDYAPRHNPDATTRAHLVTLDGTPVGFIQSYVAMGSGDGWWEDVTDPGVLGIDQFIGEPALIGRGLGTAMVRAFVARLLADPSVTYVQTDPNPANARAIRCYEKAGFRTERAIVTPDGPALLMIADRMSVPATE